MSDFFDDIFVDNDKPEFVPGLKPECPPPPAPPAPKPYNLKPKHINRPYSDKPTPGPYKPDYCAYDASNTQPNIVPNTYFIPGHKCPPPPPPPKPAPCPPPPPDRNLHPMHWEEDHGYVTKAELNRILMHIADADIFRDLSDNGTTVAVGGIAKGTKFKKLTFAEFVTKLLYSNSAVEDQEFVCETTKGKIFNNYIVKYPMGDLKVGDSLKGMTISQIISAAFCGINHYGLYEWASNEITVEAAETMIDAEIFIPKLVEDYSETGIFELHVLGTTETDPSDYVYNEIIAQKDNARQVTNVSIPQVPSDTKWSYNPESKKITLHTDGEIGTAIRVVMVKK